MVSVRAEPVLGIDLGGSKILTAVIDPDGNMLGRDHSITPAAGGPDAVMGAIFESTRRSLAQAGVTASDIFCIGIGAPGLSSPDTGIIYSSPHLADWRDVPLRTMIAEEYAKDVYLINDANAAAMGEYRFGSAMGVADFVYVTVSTGIGAGIFIEGQIYTGLTGTAGEFGHMVIDDAGPLCNCGNRGCWEMFASGSALASEARRMIASGSTSRILEISGSIENISAQTVHGSALEGDELAIKLINRCAYYLGVGLANLINIFNPALIVVGGGLANIGDMLLGPAWGEAGRRAFRQPFESARLVRAGLGRNSGVIGAAVNARLKHEINLAGGRK